MSDLAPVVISYDEHGKKIRWSQPLTGGQIDHWVSVESDAPTGSMGVNQVPEEVCLRVLCHVLTNWMPDDALPELGETLGEMYTFYRDRRIEQEPQSLLPRTVEFETEVLEPRERAAFQLPQD